MSKFHINKHGVPAPCKAKAGNCPLGGADQHFDTAEAAQAYADQINEKQHGILPGVQQSKTGDDMRKDLKSSMLTFENKNVKVNYDGKEYEGKVDSVYMPGVGSDKLPGFIIRGHDEHGAEEFKHIKLHRLENIKDKETGQEPEGMLKQAIDKEKFHGIIETKGKIEYREFGIAEKGNNIFARNVTFYDTKEDAEEQIETISSQKEMERLIKEEKKARLDKFASENFYRKPRMSDEMFDKHKKDLVKLEKLINEKIKKEHPNFEGISFGSSSNGKIRINGIHKDIGSYFYGDTIEFDIEKDNIEDVANTYKTVWGSADNEKHLKFFKSFIQDGEKYGWD